MPGERYSPARRYCGGTSGFTPSVFAARSGHAGSASTARANSTTSARPLATISAACVASVIKPDRAGGDAGAVLHRLGERHLIARMQRRNLLIRRHAARRTIDQVHIAARGEPPAQRDGVVDGQPARHPIGAGQPYP